MQTDPCRSLPPSQLVKAFSDLANSMRKAAEEAEAMANTVAGTSLPGSSQSAGLALSPAAHGAAPADSNGVTTTTAANPKKRKLKTADATSPTTNGTEAKPKKEKKIRDPNLPKRPTSAYLLFQNTVRKTLKDSHPEFDYKTIQQELSKEWSTLTPEQKIVSCDLLLSQRFTQVADSRSVPSPTHLK